MNVFLTGEIQVGKSTAIDTFLGTRPALCVKGFRTISVYGRREGALADTFIVPAVGEALIDEQHLIGIRWGKGRFDPFPEVFDREGVALLTELDGANVVLMDEIGRMENDAPRFQARLLKVLDGPVPVLGVVKPLHTPLLDAVREHPRSVVLTVTEKNRDGIPALIARNLG